MIQNQLLNYVLDTKDSSIITENGLDVSFFCDYTNEYNYIKNHLNQYGKVPDKATFLGEFSDFDVLQVDEPPAYLVSEIYKDKNKRQMASTFNKVRELICEDKIEEALHVYTTNVDKAVSNVGLSCVDILKDTSRYEDYVERCNDFQKFYVKTGFKELDEVIGGWDRHEELATIVARPNVGKSYILFKSALAAAEQGLNVGLYSGEMSSRKVGYRIDTLYSHISNTCISKGNSSVQNTYKDLLDNKLKNIKGSIKVLTPQHIGGLAGVTTLRAFIEKYSLDILFIDQHSLLEDDRKAKNPVEKAANISKDLKQLQVLKQIPIIAVSQQNRTSTEDGIGTEHIAQSDRISQDSTVIIALEKEDKTLTINLVKSRDSENGKKLKYLVDFDKGTFHYIPESADGEDTEETEELRRIYEEDNESEDNPF